MYADTNIIIYDASDHA